MKKFFLMLTMFIGIMSFNSSIKAQECKMTMFNVNITENVEIEPSGKWGNDYLFRDKDDIIHLFTVKEEVFKSISSSKKVTCLTFQVPKNWVNNTGYVVGCIKKLANNNILLELDAWDIDDTYAILYSTDGTSQIVNPNDYKDYQVISSRSWSKARHTTGLVAKTAPKDLQSDPDITKIAWSADCVYFWE